MGTGREGVPLFRSERPRADGRLKLSRFITTAKASVRPDWTPWREMRMNGISEEIIRQRAHAIWEAQGRPDGHDQEHWEQAVRELRTGSSTPMTPPAALKLPAAKTAEPKTVRQRKAPIAVKK